MGSGPPLLKAANWLTHLEFDWKCPIWGQAFIELSRCRTFIRYDERGCGLSDWDVEDLSFDAFVEDLEVVADALKLGRFPLLGISQGAAVCIEYATRHPERVSALILMSGYAAGWRLHATPENAARFQDAFGYIDVRHQLSKDRAPTLIFHSKFNQRILFEHGRALASGIPDAQFVALESANHILVDPEPALQAFSEVTRQFLEERGA